MKPISKAPRIFIVDDHPICRGGVRITLLATGRYRVCGEAGLPCQALLQLKSARADCVVVGIMYGGTARLDLISDIRRACPEIPIIVLSMLSRVVHEKEALAAGAVAYVEKLEPPDRLLSILDEVFLETEVRSGIIENSVYR